tara:strand:+ start:491 stop:1735 length:1245 start_codon:yes stop_codon:yes gene_type:complete
MIMEDLFSNIDNELEIISQITQKPKIDLTLSRVKSTLKKIGYPSQNIPAIQIAGTNGKGSIATFIESCLSNLNIKNGVTTSPHLVSWCERIKINGKNISRKDLEKCINEIKPLAIENQLSPFEIIITIALDYFAAQKVELIILEVGLGGRLDATTAHSFRPIIAFSNIGIDHCEYLGKSLEEIAKEKAAIINKNSIVISPEQESIVKEIIHQKATKMNAILKWVPPLGKDWELGLKGDFQRTNAAVAKGALEALNTLGWEIREENIRKGFENAKWPGRMQIAKWNQLPLLLDGAHNPDAAKQLSKEREYWEDQDNGVNWIIGIQKSKDATQILQYLFKSNDKIWLVPIRGHESWTRKEILEKNKNLSSRLIAINNSEEVFRKIYKDKKWPNPPPVITGSLYLIGDLIKRELIRL